MKFIRLPSEEAILNSAFIIGTSANGKTFWFHTDKGQSFIDKDMCGKVLIESQFDEGINFFSNRLKFNLAKDLIEETWEE